MLVLGLLLGLIVVLLAFPGTPLVRRLHRELVAGPARVLDRLGVGRLVFYTALAVGGLVLTLLFEAEGLRLFGLMLPDTLVWFAAFDVGVFVDALLISATLLGANGLRVVRLRIEGMTRCLSIRPGRRRGRAPRRSGRVKGPAPSSDDDDRPAWTDQAAYRVFSMA